MDDRNRTENGRAVAQQVRDHMREIDPAPALLGIRVGEVGEGFARAHMEVRPDMMNGFAILHGGLLATLADTAFAYACNSRNELTVASGIALDFIAPVRVGDVLEAVATERSRSGRVGVCDVVVTNQHGETVALMRGKSYSLKGRTVVPAPA